jgi:hypothetical protein
LQVPGAGNFLEVFFPEFPCFHVEAPDILLTLFNAFLLSTPRCSSLVNSSFANSSRFSTPPSPIEVRLMKLRAKHQRRWQTRRPRNQRRRGKLLKSACAGLLEMGLCSGATQAIEANESTAPFVTGGGLNPTVDKQYFFGILDSAGNVISVTQLSGEVTAQVPGDGIVSFHRTGEGATASNYNVAIDAAFVPEPAAGALAALGAAGLLGLTQRKCA